MFNFPAYTEFNKRIPKQKFYDNIDISPELKKLFVTQINTIYWTHKFAPSTLNVGIGEKVNEIEVFKIELNTSELNENILLQIDKQIPYHIIFFLEYDNKYQIWIGYKEYNEQGKNQFKVTRYYHSNWLNEKDINLKIYGLNIDSVYDNFVRQIAGDNLKSNENNSLKESVEQESLKLQLEKKLSKLQARLSKEKQFNRQVGLNTQIRQLKKQLENI